jgi:hypothetical protein
MNGIIANPKAGAFGTEQHRFAALTRRCHIFRDAIEV